MKKKLIAGVLLVALVVTGAVLVRSKRFVKNYFWFEQAWSQHWPIETGKHAIEGLTPFLSKIGMLRPARVTVEPGVNFLLDPRDLVPLTILRTGEWQPEVWEAISPRLREGSVFLDVGAHIGYFSLKASPRVGKTGRVIAFEPNPETLQLLRDNVAYNHAANVTVEPVACTDREQMLTFYAAPIVNTGASSLAKTNADYGGDSRAFQVRGRPIDDVVRELNLTHVDAIKIDVEGAELYVLKGAAETLKRFHPKVVLELVARQLAGFQTTEEDVKSFLKSAGYNRGKRIRADDDDWEWTLQDETTLASTVEIKDPSTSDQLISGFHSLESAGWRWTERRFTVAVSRPRGAEKNGAFVILKFTIPEVSLKELKSITLSAKAGGVALAPETFNAPGAYEYRRQVPASALAQGVIQLEFTLDKALAPPKTDGRELGVIVTSAGLVLP